MIKLSHVSVSEEAIERVSDLLRCGQVGQSEVIEAFEKDFSKWLGIKHCVAVSSGTMADTIALAVLKHFYPGRNKVIVSAHTFIAQINSIIYNGLTPIFMDGPYGFFTNKHRHDEILCFFPVHLLGVPWRWDLPIPVIEDSCEAMGSKIDGVKCGVIGDMGTFSFFPSHTITTGEGGMISTNNDDFAALARRLRNHGKVANDDFSFDVIGFNAKMTSLQAALGIEALKTIDQVIEKRRKNFFSLGGSESLGDFISPHAFPLKFESRYKRDRAILFFREKGVDCRKYFSSIPTQEKAYAHLGYKLGDFPVSEEYGDKWLYLPVHQGLTEDDISHMKAAIREA